MQHHRPHPLILRTTLMLALLLLLISCKSAEQKEAEDKAELRIATHRALTRAINDNASDCSAMGDALMHTIHTHPDGVRSLAQGEIITASGEQMKAFQDSDEALSKAIVKHILDCARQDPDVDRALSILAGEDDAGRITEP